MKQNLIFGEKINNFWKLQSNLIRNRLEDANNYEVLIGELEAVSGIEINTLIELFKRGYTLQKNNKEINLKDEIKKFKRG